MSRMHVVSFAMLSLCLVAATVLIAQPPGRPPMRRHTITSSSGSPRLVPATNRPTTANDVSIEIEGGWRVIRANGIPNHATGAFPNRGNPHRIESQRYVYRIPAQPQPAEAITPLAMQNFGIAVNGVPFDPGAAEWYLGDPRGGWQYEALSGAIALGIDASHAHVQPTGAYHYHGLPNELLGQLALDESKHSPLIGWAADGFPIYAVYGYATADDPASAIKPLQSSFRLRAGTRPARQGEPGGKYDGTFVQDYEFVEGSGDLDLCNGRFCVTPDFPEGTYAYFLTEAWPVVPRNFRGTPSDDFRRRRGPR